MHHGAAATASFPSVWALEVLLILRHERRAWVRAELVSTLRASDLVVSNALDALLAAGLVSVEADGVHYLPVNEQLGACVDRVEYLYRTRPNKVRRAIISARGNPISATSSRGNTATASIVHSRNTSRSSLNRSRWSRTVAGSTACPRSSPARSRRSTAAKADLKVMAAASASRAGGAGHTARGPKASPRRRSRATISIRGMSS